MNYVSRYIVAGNRKQDIETLAEQGKTMNEICEILHLNYSCVYGIISRNKINVIKEKIYEK